ncbi:MAG: tRNA (N(6)-L-threonylcarbamoyladenosine(37)-C(2))-methylthiotransferase MtaB [Proteobacteria bacterium]|nr:tRNA (N(6)-L-threonylcarbamoyladenosine(37)-C(2))-methylthiotransferase MtaB [Pseudomonadota bacterium]
MTKSPRVDVVTLGCRLNTYESEAMRDLAASHADGDVVIINTCAVTGMAERHSRQAVRRAVKDNPNAKIIVTGCSAQLSPHVYEKMPGVTRVLGNHDKMQSASFLPQVQEKVIVSDIAEVRESAHHLVHGFDAHARAFIQIQNGCDHRCTFCTIPFARGPNRSVGMGEIVRQVQVLVDQGVKEVVLTGVDITDYGQDLPGTTRLATLVERLLVHVPDLPRLRLSSLDPSEVDEELFDLMQEARFMPHLHVSFQAGDNMILKRMKRRHLREDAFAFCERVRAKRPDAVFGADFIAGFPTESDQMFAKTLEAIDICDLTYLHVFPFSPRPGTPAARMPQLDGSLISARAAKLREVGAARVSRFLQTLEGTRQDVLVEEGGRGHTPHFAPVSFEEKGDALPALGEIVQTVVAGATPTHLLVKRI